MTSRWRSGLAFVVRRWPTRQPKGPQGPEGCAGPVGRTGCSGEQGAPGVRAYLIMRYRELLETETDNTKRETISSLLSEEEAKLARIEERGQPDVRDWGDGRGMPPSVDDLRAVRIGIGAALRTLHSDVLRDAIPSRIAELFRQIDQRKDPDEG
jgi:hypothetical protein